MIYILFILSIFCAGAFYKLLFRGRHQQAVADRYFVCTVMFMAWLIMSLRDITVGVDTAMYCTFFNRYESAPISKIFTTVIIEPGWASLAWLINYIGGNFVLFQMVFYGIFCYLCANFIILGNGMLRRDSTFIITVVLLAGCWLLSFNIARQMIAVMFILNAWLYFCQHKRKKAAALFILALSFHYSSILALALIILWKMRNVRHFGFITMASLAACYFLFGTIMSIAGQMGVYVNYINNAFNNFQEANMVKIIWTIIAFHAVWIFIKSKKFTPFDKVVAAYSLIYVFTNIMASQINYFERLGLFFMPFVALLYPIVGNSFKSRQLRYIYFTGIAVCYSIWFILGSRSPQYAYSISSLL